MLRVEPEQARRAYAGWVRSWLRVEHASGPDEIERVYLDPLEGKSDPAVGHVVSPQCEPSSSWCRPWP